MFASMMWVLVHYCRHVDDGRHWSAQPAGPACMAVRLDLCALEVGRPVSGPAPVTKINHPCATNCVQ